MIKSVLFVFSVFLAINSANALPRVHSQFKAVAQYGVQSTGSTGKGCDWYKLGAQSCYDEASWAKSLHIDGSGAVFGSGDNGPKLEKPESGAIVSGYPEPHHVPNVCRASEGGFAYQIVRLKSVEGGKGDSFEFTGIGTSGGVVVPVTSDSPVALLGRQRDGNMAKLNAIRKNKKNPLDIGVEESVTAHFEVATCSNNGGPGVARKPKCRVKIYCSPVTKEFSVTYSNVWNDAPPCEILVGDSELDNGEVGIVKVRGGSGKKILMTTDVEASELSDDFTLKIRKPGSRWQNMTASGSSMTIEDKDGGWVDLGIKGTERAIAAGKYQTKATLEVECR